MSNRGTQNAPNTRHPKRPPRKPARLDQFADDIDAKQVEFGMDLGVTNRKEAQEQRRSSRKHQ